MTTDPTDPFDQAQRELATWHSIHPRATLAEIEVAVEQQIDRLRAHLLEARTAAGFQEEHPLCAQCGSTMVPRAQSTRRLLLRGDHALDLARSYVVCPTCGAGLFPPG